MGVFSWVPNPWSGLLEPIWACLVAYFGALARPQQASVHVLGLAWKERIGDRFPRAWRAVRGPNWLVVATVYNATLTALLGFPWYCSLALSEATLSRSRSRSLSSTSFLGAPPVAVTLVGISAKWSWPQVRSLIPISFALSCCDLWSATDLACFCYGSIDFYA